ncbi:MAG TPA: thioredoxin family protein [Kofleriaceae bacterium]|jgi:thioredoxin 1
MPGRGGTSPGMAIKILKFTAPWCVPCKTLAPTLAAVATEYRVPLEEIDVERDQLAAQRYDVRAMPTVVILRDGVEVGRTVGVRPRTFLAGMLDRALAGDVAIACP